MSVGAKASIATEIYNLAFGILAFVGLVVASWTEVRLQRRIRTVEAGRTDQTSELVRKCVLTHLTELLAISACLAWSADPTSSRSISANWTGGGFLVVLGEVVLLKSNVRLAVGAGVACRTRTAGTAI